MYKIVISSILLFLSAQSFGQTLEDKMQQQSIHNKFNEQSHAATIDDEWNKTFSGLNHPLAITGGILTLGGARTYVAGSEGQNNHNYQPQTTLQYIGIGAFAAGAVLFAIFSTERDKNLPKRKKAKQKYNASE